MTPHPGGPEGKVLPCLACGKKLKPIHNDPPTTQPDDAVRCVAVGNYGSTELDNLFGKVRWFNVCDECFRLCVNGGRTGPLEDTPWNRRPSPASGGEPLTAEDVASVLTAIGYHHARERRAEPGDECWWEIPERSLQLLTDALNARLSRSPAPAGPTLEAIEAARKAFRETWPYEISPLVDPAIREALEAAYMVDGGNK